MPHFTPGSRWAAVLLSITSILGLSQDVRGRRLGTGKSLSSPWARSVLAQVLALTSPEHHFEVCQWGAPSKLHVLSTGASATQNARWTHRGLNAKEKASHGAMRSTQLRKSRKRLCPMAPRDHLQNWVQAQDFYFCLDTRQKIALCASCGMTKLENKLYGGFGWHSYHGRLCVSFASVEC